MYILHQIIRNPKNLCLLKQLILTHRGDLGDFLIHHAHMAYCLHNITGSRLALGTDHGSSLVDAAERLPKILCAAHKRHIEFALVDVEHIVSRGENFALVNVIDLNGFEDLCLHKMTDPAFCHNRNGYSLLNALDHLRIAHAGNAACRADICRDALQRHNCARACLFRDPCLLRGSNIHDNAAL